MTLEQQSSRRGQYHDQGLPAIPDNIRASRSQGVHTVNVVWMNPLLR